MNDCLVIVGNGFDLAHQYRTAYSDFKQYSGCPYLTEFQRFSEKYGYKDQCSGGNWYDFENTMNRITLCWFERLNDAECEENDAERAQVLKDIRRINRIFRSIGLCLKEYIADVTAANLDFKLDNVQKCIAPDTNVLSFNYSNVAERYSDNVHYIHGSVREQTIIFGYPERYEPDVIEDSATLFAKGKLRELLNFNRFLSSKGINTTSKQGSRLLKAMDTQVQCLFGACGAYASDPDVDPMPKLIREYDQKYNYAAAPIDFGVDIHQVKELIIMGHSLKADKDIFDLIFAEADNLQNIKIFTYPDENPVELKEKIDFFHDEDVEFDKTTHVVTSYY